MQIHRFLIRFWGVVLSILGLVTIYVFVGLPSVRAGGPAPDSLFTCGLTPHFITLGGKVFYVCSAGCSAGYRQGGCPAGASGCVEVTSRFCNCTMITKVVTESGTIPPDSPGQCPPSSSECTFTKINDQKCSYSCTWEVASCSGPCSFQDSDYNGCSNNTTCHRCECKDQRRPPSPCNSISPFRTVHKVSVGYEVDCRGDQYNCFPQQRYPTCDYYENYVNSCTKFTLNAYIRFKKSGAGVIEFKEEDPGDAVVVGAIRETPADCGMLVDKKTQQEIKRGTVFKNLDPAASSAPVPRIYKKEIRYIPGHPSYIDSKNECTSKIMLTLVDSSKGLDASDTLGYSQCSTTVTVYYPPTQALSVRLIDRNDASIAPIDKKSGVATVTKNPLRWVGGLGHDPLKLTQRPSNPNVNKLIVETPFRYMRTDGNPFDVKVVFWDENGTSDFNVEDQEILLVHQSGREYPISRGRGKVNPNVLGLLDPSAAISVAPPNTSGFGTFIDMLSCLKSATYCTRRTNVGTVTLSPTQIPSGGGGSPQLLAQEATIHVYQANLPEGRYFVRVKTIDKEGARWQKDFRNAYFIVDNTPPSVKIQPIVCGQTAGTNDTECVVGGRRLGGDIVKVILTVNDNNNLPNDPLFATFVYVTGKKHSEFLKLWDPNTAKQTNIRADGTNFGLYRYFKLRKKTPKSVEYEFFTVGVRAEDKIYMGFCAYDIAGNIACDGNVDMFSGNTPGPGPGPGPGPSPTPIKVGANWLKTSLGNVYSAGGFTKLPDYGSIHGISEKPIQSFIRPFNAASATIGNFLVAFDRASGVGQIRWGYNGYYNSLPFRLIGRKIDKTFNNYESLKELALLRCAQLGANCKVYNLITPSAVHMESFLEDATKFKVVLVNVDPSTEVVFPFSVACRGVNLIFVDKGVLRFIKPIYKYFSRKPPMLPGEHYIHPLANYKEGCVFMLGPTDDARMIIDDNPADAAFISGREVLHDRVTGEGIDLDLVQAGIVAFDKNALPANPQIWIKQMPRDIYRDEDGYFDALLVHGFIYSASVPKLERDLTFSDNKKYPSEWIVYDASLLDLFGPLLGKRKSQTIRCGVNNHPWCSVPLIEREGL